MSQLGNVYLLLQIEPHEPVARDDAYKVHGVSQHYNSDSYILANHKIGPPSLSCGVAASELNLF